MSDFDCFCDYEPASVYRQKLVKHARKEHKCYECGRKIAVGESYEYVFAVWEGDGQSAPTCQHCLDLREFVKADVPCFCWAHGNMIDDAYETMYAYAHEADGLRFGVLRRHVLINRARRTAKSESQ